MKMSWYVARLAAVMVALLLAVVPAAHAAWWWPFGEKGIRYAVALDGVDGDILHWLKELKLDERNKSLPATTEAELEQELVVRGGRVRQAMEAIGYYDSVIQQDIVRDGEDRVLRYRIQPGPRYTVGDIVMQWDGEPLKEIDVNTLRSKVGGPVNAADILLDSVQVLDEVGQRACLLALDVSPLVRLYEKRRRAVVVFRIKHGAKADFGPTEVTGTERVSKDVVMRGVTWRQGRCFRQSKVDETREKLIESQLFSAVTITHPAVPDANGEVPMTVDVKERAARTLRAGANYSTDEGVVVTSGWEHRNLFGGGEKLNVDGSFGQEEQSLSTALRLPDFWTERQTLVLTGGLSHEDRDAYTADTLETGARLERKLGRRWRGGLGVGVTLKQTEDVLAGRSEYGLVSFPGFVEYDSRRNILDPRRGVLANVTVTPYTETFGDGGQFLKSQFNVQTYISAPVMLSPTLAFRVAGGTITGADGTDVPSDIRFYAGGGGSVRGYGYQKLGPRKGTEVIGGNSFIAASAEARLRFTEEFGGVVFTDVGNAYAGKLPESNEKLYSSVGVGVRYYTGIGPIRADIAVPLNGQDIGARGYALYISIGQSF